MASLKVQRSLDDALSTESDATNTFTSGLDAGTMAARARALGLEARAARIEREDNSRRGQFVESIDALLDNERVLIELLAGRGDSGKRVLGGKEEEGDDDDEGDAGFSTEETLLAIIKSVTGLLFFTFQSGKRVLGGKEEEGDDDDESDAGFSTEETLLAIIKSVIGPAVLYVPKGFELSGIALAALMMLVSFALVAWSSSGILEICLKMKITGYTELAGKAFGRPGAVLSKFYIVLQQCGLCLTYFIFVASNLQSIIADFSGVNISLGSLCFWQLAVYVPLTLIRDIKSFAPTNLVANGLILYSLLVLGAFAVATVHLHRSELLLPAEDAPQATANTDQEEVATRNPANRWFNFSQCYLFAGTAAFLFEGTMALALPLQGAVKPSLRHGFPALFVGTLGVIISVYLAFGFINDLAYGEATDMILTRNLPPSPWQQPTDDGGRSLGGWSSVLPWKVSVQVAYIFAVMFTFPLQLFPAVQILQAAFDDTSARIPSSEWSSREKVALKNFGESFLQDDVGNQRTDESEMTAQYQSLATSESISQQQQQQQQQKLKNQIAPTVTSSLLPAMPQLPSFSTPPTSPVKQAQEPSIEAPGDVSDVSPQDTNISAEKGASHWRGNIGRTFLVFTMCVIASACTDRLDKLVSLVGALVGIPLTFCMPPLIHRALALPDTPLWVLRTDLAVAAFGVVLSIVCSAITAVTW
eukprot:CAMPEP_0171988548 /NCGR_PEP_ID=MMETSP0993-20121228/275957_1 /TAXON_ID=483369 /ORGANISM="non described non described, Strain CCMP2098" /LENGTH=700 /DNA_ID=CAMNT_0012641523 /DNA_START=80 /DNA_END=2183 /DNA_ORIENTATION=+